MPYEFLRTLEGHELSVSGVRFSPDSKQLASTSADKTITIWCVDEGDARFGERLFVLEGHEKGVNDCAWSPLQPQEEYSGRYLVSASDDKRLKTWDLSTGAEVATLAKHDHYVSCCAWSPRGNMIASGSFDETVVLWSVNDGGSPVRTLPAHSDPVTGVAFCPDGALLASSSLDGLCRVWAVETGHCLRTVMPYASAQSAPPALSSVLFPSERFVLAACMDGALRMYDMETKQFVRQYLGLKNKEHLIVPCIALIPEARRQLVVSGSEDGSIVVFDVNTKAKDQQPVQVIPPRESQEAAGVGHAAVVLAAGASPRGGLLATAAKVPDLAIRIWKWKG